MNVKEKWFMLAPGASKVKTVEVMERTKATILVRDIDFFGMPGEASRYEINSIKWLEQLSENYPQE